MAIEMKHPLVSLKVILFCWFGSNACLVPYMTIHMRQLGLSVEETALIYTLLPFTNIVGPPIAGFAADKLGKYKSVLLLSLVLVIVSATGILFVPSSPKAAFIEGDPAARSMFNLSLSCDELNAPKYQVSHRCSCEFLMGQHLKAEPIKGHCDSIVFDYLGEQSLNVTPDQSLELFIGEACDLEAVVTEKWEKPFPIASGAACDRSLSRCDLSADCSEAKLGLGDRLSSAHQTTFWSYFLLRIVFSTFSNICFSLVEATAVVLCEVHKAEYGRQRLWAMLAMGVSSPICGFLIDRLSIDPTSELTTNYNPAFYAFNALVVMTIFFTAVLDLEVIPPPPDVWKHIRPLLRSLDIWIFLLVVLFSGTLWGFVENFLFWYLIDLSAPKYLLGLTLTVGAIIGLPFLHSSEWFLEKAGRVNILILALVFYMLRFVGYSYIHNPWLCIPFEAMEAFTLHLMWVSAVTYAASLTPPGLTATIQGTVGSIHYGVGRGLGSFVGGGLMAAFGPRMAFRTMGIGAGVIAVLYATYHYTTTCWRGSHEQVPAEPPRIEVQGPGGESAEAEDSSPQELKEHFTMGEDAGHHPRRVRKDSVLSISSINMHYPKPFLA